MNTLVRGLTWPVLALVAIGTTHVVAETVRPELQTVLGPGVVMPIYLVAGAWAGLATIRAGGTVGHGIAAAAALGLLPVGLQLIGFGVLLARDPQAVTTSAILGFVSILWGGFLGSGIGRSTVEVASAQGSEARNRNTGTAVA